MACLENFYFSFQNWIPPLAKSYFLAIKKKLGRLKLAVFTITVYVNIIVDIYLFIEWFISESVLVIPEDLNGVCRHSGLDKK